MRLAFEVQADKVIGMLSKFVRQIPYAAKDAINQTALQIQAAERAEMQKVFTIRKSKFMLQRVKMFTWAKVQSLAAVLGLDTRVQGSRLLLSAFEQGGKKDPSRGSHIAIPITGTKARPVFQRAVPLAYRMDRLGLHSILSRKGGKAAVRGLKRTFILPTKRGEYALFQREGKGKVGLLYIFRKTVTLRKRMNFIKTARGISEWSIPRLFHRYMKKYKGGCK